MRYATEPQVVRVGSALVVRVLGAFVGPSAGEVGARVAAAVRRRPAPSAVLFDLGACDTIDGVALAALGALDPSVDVVLFGADPLLAGEIALLGAPARVRTATRDEARAMLARLAGPPSPGDERRRHARLPLHGIVELRWREPDGRLPEAAVSLRDLSLGGVGLTVGEALAAEISAALAREGDGDLELRCPPLLGRDWARGRFVAHGAVGRDGPTMAVGLEFRGLGPDATNRIRSLVGN